MDHRIFNVRTDVNPCHCTRGCTNAVRESALKVDSGRKIHWRTGESNLPQRVPVRRSTNWATSPSPSRETTAVSQHISMDLYFSLPLYKDSISFRDIHSIDRIKQSTLIRYLCLEKCEDEWAGKVEVEVGGKACKPMFWLSPGFQKTTCDSSHFCSE